MALQRYRYHTYNKIFRYRTRELRKNGTKAEKHFWYKVLKPAPIRAHRQRPIDKFIVDFYIPYLKLIVELDGDYHFTDEQLIIDSERDSILNNLGYRILRIRNDEALAMDTEKFMTILDQYKTFLSQTEPVSSRGTRPLSLTAAPLKGELSRRIRNYDQTNPNHKLTV